MSQPRLSGEQLAVTVDASVLRVTSDPGFTSDNGDGCPYRSVYLQGPTVFGTAVAARTKPAERWEGFFETRQALADWRLTLSEGAYRLLVYAGSLFQPWVPGQEGPFIEWGSDDHGQNPSGVPRVNSVTFTVGAAPPPPPPPPPGHWTLEANEQEMVRVGYLLVEQWRRNGMSDVEIRNTMHYQTILALGTKGPKRQEIKTAIRRILG